MALNSLQIIEVKGKKALEQFIRLPWSIYHNDPTWTPPLLLERRQHFSLKNPYFEHATCCLWLAYRGTQLVGRISAQIDDLHLQRYQDNTGFWGMLEAEDNLDTFQLLLNTAEHWLQARGIRNIQGPFNFSINQECGLLVKGFDSPPMVMMGHAKPYYQEMVEHHGYVKIKDLLAYYIDLSFQFPPIIEKLLTRSSRDMTIRSLRRSQFQKDLGIIQEIFEDAWSDNWGFLPFTQKEFSEIGQQLRWLVDKSYIKIAEVDGAPAAMLVAFPNINEVIHDFNGRLLPFGWLKAIVDLKLSKPKTARVPLMGVRKIFQRTPLGAALAFGLIDEVRKSGIRHNVQHVELSWILEDNQGMCKMLESIGGIPYKTYRIYAKTVC